MTAFILPPVGKTRAYAPANGKSFSLREVQAAVGGFVESLPVSDQYLMILDEDGKSKDKPLNERATKILHLAGGSPSDYVVGDVLICERGMVE
jgi:hypothetical protein